MVRVKLPISINNYRLPSEASIVGDYFYFSSRNFYQDIHRVSLAMQNKKYSLWHFPLIARWCVWHCEHLVVSAHTMQLSVQTVIRGHIHRWLIIPQQQHTQIINIFNIHALILNNIYSKAYSRKKKQGNVFFIAYTRISYITGNTNYTNIHLEPAFLISTCK